jgi:hypothetical protein
LPFYIVLRCQLISILEDHMCCMWLSVFAKFLKIYSENLWKVHGNFSNKSMYYKLFCPFKIWLDMSDAPALFHTLNRCQKFHWLILYWPLLMVLEFAAYKECTPCKTRFSLDHSVKTYTKSSSHRQFWRFWRMLPYKQNTDASHLPFLYLTSASIIISQNLQK